VLGLTTAATLWIATMVRLCFGGRRHALGLAGAALAFAILRGLRPLEERMRESRGATLSAQWPEGAFALAELMAGIAAAKLELQRCCLAQSAAGTCEVRRLLTCKGEAGRYGPPAELVLLLQRAGARCSGKGRSSRARRADSLASIPTQALRSLIAKTSERRRPCFPPTRITPRAC
jgi:putative Mg2+ transporter-C (MgtC) family protein